LTKGVLFTPFLATTHQSNRTLFKLGEAATEEIGRVAEGGDIGPLRDQLQVDRAYFDFAQTDGLLNPGETVSFTITSPYRYGKFSLISMALPTNDTLVALRNAQLPFYRQRSATYFLSAYDAGTETNDELCANIPGPQCGGSPFSPDDAGEGYIYPSAGIHGEGDLTRAAYNWGEKVAMVKISRNF
ncbi:MAG: spondin domain-containing protein, partial [Cellvibrionaceae bacterium]|nr:spondin domain-containing protein [Cellvibrionaceae bacterium]